jgi:hypothetical protein
MDIIAKEYALDIEKQNLTARTTNAIHEYNSILTSNITNT